MKNYIAPKMDIVLLRLEDIITASIEFEIGANEIFGIADVH